MRQHFWRLVLGLAPFAAALLCAGGASAASSDLAVSGGWLRVVIASRPAAGYFTLKNNGSKPRHLVGAESPACGSIMLHKSVEENGQDSMVMVMSITVPAHGSVRFAPGGYHLMCMRPTQAAKPGAATPVTLKFKNGQTLTTNFAVRNALGD